MEDKPNVFPHKDDEGNEKQNNIDKMNEIMRIQREEELARRQQANPPTEPTTIPLKEDLKVMSKKPIVEPDWGSDFDVIKLPSEGKLYNPKKPSVKVSFMNAGDENILTNPNLLMSGKFLEVLISRKILETDLSYKDLLIGDRDAIMLWLRSTGYGNMYPIEVTDPDTGVEFETEIDLSELKTIKMSAEPDEEGLFEYTLPSTKKLIKFKLLTVGDTEDLENYSIEAKDDYDLATYSLKKHIVEIDGNRSREFINEFVPKIRIMESRQLKKYMSDIEPKIDLNLTIQGPGGAQVKTFFPLNPSFFWPEL